MASPLRQRGRIVDWLDERGFGFIKSPDLRDRVWVHVNDFVSGTVRPMVVDEVEFAVVEGRDGRPAAKQVQIASSTVGRQPPNGGEAPTPLRVAVRLVAALFFLGFVLTCTLLQRLSPALLLIYAGAGLASAALYRLDKQAALRGEWRTPEFRLHAIDLAFGIVGGLIAQAAFRHKTSKPAFAIVTAIIFAIHVGLVLLLLGAVV